MKYIKFTYVDAVTKISIASDPARNGPVFPDIPGLQFVWANESRYPTDLPHLFGTCPDSSNTQLDGVLGVFSQQDWENMQADELAARPVPPTLQERVVTATQERLDDFAKTRNYDGILSACTYATSTVTKFQGEGQHCVTARDETWAALYAMMAEVQAGTRPMPGSVEEVLALLPVLEWPVW